MGNKLLSIKTSVIRVIEWMLLIFLLMLAHEFGHCISAELLGGNMNGIYIDFNEMMMVSHVNLPSSKISRIIVIISGSLTSSLMSILLIVSSYNKENKVPFHSGFVLLTAEASYWGMSPPAIPGDAYLLSKALDMNPTCISTTAMLIFYGLFITYLILLTRMRYE